MLHLLPVRQLLVVVISLIGLSTLSAMYAGYVGTGDSLTDAIRVIRYSTALAVALPILLYAAWRWIPLLQEVTFPYLGGEWRGRLDFQGARGSGFRDVTLDISHTLFRLKLVLDSAESTSRTLVAHAEHDPELNRRRLYYVYLNERKEGALGAGSRYKGLAILRVEHAGGTLHGDYFTEEQNAGKLHMHRLRKHSWWKLWK
jgi:SMODS-associating 2TM, beta-strand rich effector domain